MEVITGVMLAIIVFSIIMFAVVLLCNKDES